MTNQNPIRESNDAYWIPLSPWTNRLNAIPKRTWTGRVVYTRKKHNFSAKDLSRIIAKINIEQEVETETGLKKFLKTIKEITILMLEKILFFLTEDDIRELYDWIYTLLGTIFRVDIDYMMPHRYQMEDLIYQLASKARLDITIKRL